MCIEGNRRFGANCPRTAQYTIQFFWNDHSIWDRIGDPKPVLSRIVSP
jgi:hypothetical protein